MERFIEELKELIALRDKVDDSLRPALDRAIKLLIEEHVRRDAQPINYPQFRRIIRGGRGQL
mgnify:CR=1 FL=1